ncbi:DUF4190 domain-containing protein [Luteolibacter sp. LG18]|uniref:DUF4190 domain-containing protein n=1 Tax=Luteolibacter sp. LG18 TaxID=2819286 RepID=UPI002B29F677|nr:hypothetical protein llg_38540 [Luteolibacter sp. LG18]
MNAPDISAPTTSKAAVASLICGIGGFLTGPLTGIPAIITGHIAHGNIRRAGGTLGGGGMALAGLIMGYITSFLIGGIALLAGIATPALLRQQEKAALVMLTSDMRQMQLAFVDFESDYDSYPSDALAARVKEETGQAAKNSLYQLEAAGTVSDLKSLLHVTRKMKGGWNYFPGAKSTDVRRLVLISPSVNGKHKALFSDGTILDFSSAQQEEAVLKAGPGMVLVPVEDVR